MPTSAMKKAATHSARNSLQDAANSLLGLINSLFGAGQHPMADRRNDAGPQEGEGSEQMRRARKLVKPGNTRLVLAVPLLREARQEPGALAPSRRQEMSSLTSQFMLPRLSHRSKIDARRFLTTRRSSDKEPRDSDHRRSNYRSKRQKPRTNILTIRGGGGGGGHAGGFGSSAARARGRNTYDWPLVRAR
jgi:hypothetical protein